MQKVRVVYAPNQTELSAVRRRIKEHDEEKVKEALLDFLSELAICGEEETSAFNGSEFAAQISVEAHAFFSEQKKHYNEIYMQPLMWILTTIHWRLEREAMKTEGQTFDKTYYAGCSFGEFWAITYNLYENKKINLLEAVFLAYFRGKTMRDCIKSFENNKNTEFGKAIFKPANSDEKQMILQNVSELEKYFNRPIGKLYLRNGLCCFFGAEHSLKGLARKFKGRFIPSMPFHSKYLLKAGRDFVGKLNKSQEFKSKVDMLALLSEDVITNKAQSPDKPCLLGGIFVKGFYDDLDENSLFDAINQKTNPEENEVSFVYL